MVIYSMKLNVCDLHAGPVINDVGLKMGFM